MSYVAPDMITADNFSFAFSANVGLYLLIFAGLILGFYGRELGRLGAIVFVGVVSYEVFLFALFLWYYVNFGVGTIYIKLGV